ncbi:unnamed protein product [Echinostoma caproni]|uniref:Uncharacterized protein n=1 Tax=Echinostoma caproni TaxID=27848 RepID=A0A3P8L870_9TREM|nr:unnamed protein product [Echinostoma caproni]
MELRLANLVAQLRPGHLPQSSPSSPSASSNELKNDTQSDTSQTASTISNSSLSLTLPTAIAPPPPPPPPTFDAPLDWTPTYGPWPQIEEEWLEEDGVVETEGDEEYVHVGHHPASSNTKTRGDGRVSDSISSGSSVPSSISPRAIAVSPPADASSHTSRASMYRSFSEEELTLTRELSDWLQLVANWFRTPWSYISLLLPKHWLSHMTPLSSNTIGVSSKNLLAIHMFLVFDTSFNALSAFYDHVCVRLFFHCRETIPVTPRLTTVTFGFTLPGVLAQMIYMALLHLAFAVCSHLLIYWTWLRPCSRKWQPDLLALSHSSYTPLPLVPLNSSVGCHSIKQRPTKRKDNLSGSSHYSKQIKAHPTEQSCVTNVAPSSLVSWNHASEMKGTKRPINGNAVHTIVLTVVPQIETLQLFSYVLSRLPSKLHRILLARTEPECRYYSEPGAEIRPSVAPQPCSRLLARPVVEAGLTTGTSEPHPEAACAITTDVLEI